MNKNDWQKILASGGEISLSAQTSNASVIAQHFLRHYRSKKSYLIEEQNLPETIIENIRCALRSGKLIQAQDEIIGLNNENLTIEQKLELLIEKTRLSLFSNDLYQALDYSALFFSLSPTCELSKMTVLQLRSDIYLRLEDLESSLENALAAYNLAKQFPLASSATSTCMFLAILYSKKNNSAQAFDTIHQHEKLINTCESVDLWLDRQLIICRGKFRVYLENKDYENAFIYLKLAQIISEFNQQKVIHNQCLSDLIQWGDYFKPYTTKNIIYSRSQMTYIDQLSVLIDFDLQEVYRINKKSTQEKIIINLLNNITDKHQLFENVWGLKYNKDIHDGLIRTHFYQLKKVIPNFKKLQC